MDTAPERYGGVVAIRDRRNAARGQAASRTMTALAVRGWKAGLSRVAAAAPLLAVDGVIMRFGGIVALDQVSFTVDEGQITGLIGPNGAGKTTLFNVLSRLYRPSQGDIRFDGRSLLGLPPHRIAAAGIGRTFQNLALFKSMTVIENVIIGAHATGESGFLSDTLRLPSVRKEEATIRRRALDMLAIVGLAAVAYRPITALPFGTQKRVEIARSLASSPKLLLLDEPAGGLNHEEVAELSGMVQRIRDDLDVTILLVEHHMSFVMGVSDKIVALDFGRVIAEGTPDAVQRNQAVIKAYLGEAA
jgi:branched-chain amino acid transport system ATP-binding protein